MPRLGVANKVPTVYVRVFNPIYFLARLTRPSISGCQPVRFDSQLERSIMQIRGENGFETGENVLCTDGLARCLKSRSAYGAKPADRIIWVERTLSRGGFWVRDQRSRYYAAIEMTVWFHQALWHSMRAVRAWHGI